MTNYQHILVAVDFIDSSETLLAHAQELATRCQAKLSMIHVVDSLPIADTGYGADVPFNLDLTTEFLAVAQQQLSDLADKFHIPKTQQCLEIGSPATEIMRIAKDQDVDLILLGSHGRHGLALLLGSTANDLLHHAPCDVLAVRLLT